MDRVVFFEFGRPDTRPDAFYAEGFEVFIKDNRGNAFVLVIGLNADQVKNNVFASLLGF